MATRIVVVVERRDAEGLHAAVPRQRGGLDIEVVEDLDVVGQEADGGQDDVGHPARARLVERGGQVRSQPVAPVRALALERDATRHRSERRPDGRRRGAHLALVGVALPDDGGREAVRGHQDRGGGGVQAFEGLVDALREGLAQGRRLAPAGRARKRDARALGRGQGVLGVDVGRVLGQRDDADAGDAVAGEVEEHVLHVGLPEAVGEAHGHPQHRAQLAGERGVDGVERRLAADGLVPAPQLGDEPGARRAAAADVGHERGQIVEVVDGPVGHEDDRGAPGHRALFSCT